MPGQGTTTSLDDRLDPELLTVLAFDTPDMKLLKKSCLVNVARGQRYIILKVIELLTQDIFYR